jgi:hypothetical protein
MGVRVGFEVCGSAGFRSEAWDIRWFGVGWVVAMVGLEVGEFSVAIETE